MTRSDGARPRDDREHLVRVAVAGQVAPARLGHDLPWTDVDGRPVVLPGNGGVAIGVHAGDPVDRWAGDHLMVGATIEDPEGNPAVAGPLHQLACLGDRVRLGDGTLLGVVAGKRGGLAPGFLPPQLVSVEAPDERLATLLPGVRVVLEAVGRGLSLSDHPDIGVLNLSPALLDRVPLALRDGALVARVRATVPARAMGPGMGQDPWIGDIEIADPTALSPAVALAYGDLVAICDLDGRVSRYRRPGHVAIGAVAHGPSPAAGHGVGLTVILSGPSAALSVELDDDASLASALHDLARGEEGPA
ncbi:MAG: DUF4438 domain-containing protein [Chloroflexota bacterium]